MAQWNHPGPEIRDRWFSYLESLGFAAHKKLLGSRWHDPWECAQWQLGAGVGRPAKGEHFKDYKSCGSKFCPECQAGRRVVGVQWKMKAKLRTMEAAFRDHFKIKRPLRYLMVTLTPPSHVTAFWHYLSLGRHSGRGVVDAADVDWDEMQKQIPKLEYEKTTRFSENGIYHKIYGDGSFEVAHKIWESAIRELKKTAELALTKALTAAVGADLREARIEVRFGFEIAIHFIGKHGFYPHAAAVIPEYYQERKKGSRSEWKWKLLPERVFEELTTYLMRVKDMPFEPVTCKPIQGVLESAWTGKASYPGTGWGRDAGVKPRRKKRKRVPQHVITAEDGLASTYPTLGVDVRVVTHELEAVINYLFGWPLTKTYRHFLKDPDSVERNEALGQGIKAVMRYVTLKRRGPRLVAHLGIFAPRVFSRALASLTDCNISPDSHGRYDWVDVHRALQEFLDKKELVRVRGARRLIVSWLSLREKKRDDLAEATWGALTSLLLSHREFLQANWMGTWDRSRTRIKKTDGRARRRAPGLIPRWLKIRIQRKHRKTRMDTQGN